MPELDFGNIYSPNGKIIQHRYAQKAVESGPAMIAMRNSRGAVLLVTKPIVSNLHVVENDHRIKCVADNAYMSYTGILTDGQFISAICKDAANEYTGNFNSEITGGYLRKIIADYMYMFTSYTSTRVIGASLFTIVRDEGEYTLLFADCTGKVSKWHACAAGRGERRAVTELEKLQLEDMEIEDMVDQGIKILYMCHDALTESRFDIEVCHVSDKSNGNFVRLKREDIAGICEKYEDLSIDVS